LIERSDPDGASNTTVSGLACLGKPAHPSSQGPLDRADGMEGARSGVPQAGSVRQVATPLDDAVRWVLDAAAPVPAPVDGRVAAAVEPMAEAVATGVGLLDGRSWEWRNGRLDASDFTGRRDELFRSVPGAAAGCV